MKVEKRFWDLIPEGLQKCKPVKVGYASDIVLIALHNWSKRDITTSGPGRFSK